MKSKLSPRFLILSILIVSSASLIPSFVSANPVVVNNSHYVSKWVLLMFCANLPANLFLYSLALMISAKKWGMMMGDIPRETRSFAYLILATVIMITLAGIATDYFFLTADIYIGFYFNILSVSIGIILIFVFIVCVSLFILRLKILPSIIVGLMIAILNPFFWTIGLISYPYITIFLVLIPVLSMVFGILFFYILIMWHIRVNSEISSVDSEIIEIKKKFHRKRARELLTVSIIVLVIILLPITINALSADERYHGIVTANYMYNTITNGKRITIVSISSIDFAWNEVTIQLTDGTNFAEWSPRTGNLDYGSQISFNYSTDNLGPLIVCCLVVDITGNGFINGGDYFEIFTYGGAPTFFEGSTYNAVLINEYVGNKVGQGVSFSG